MNDKEMINEIKQDFKKHEEKHKQIEEIVKEIAECNKESCQNCKLTCTYHYAIKRFCELFLPEASIVLSIEEQDKLYQKGFYDGKQFAEKFYKLFVRAETRQETVEKDFNAIIQALEERKDRVKDFYGVNESVGVDIAIRTVKELAKQLGVEIKE